MSLSFSEARHLYARLGFGAKATDITDLVGETADDVITSFFDDTQTTSFTSHPPWVDELPPPGKIRKSMSKADKKQFRKQQKSRARELKAWWFEEMIKTPSPLTERMTLFWHNHFTSSSRKVKWPGFLFQQNKLLRRHALGNFTDLLHAIAKDPAMLIYLDNRTNHKNKPNENFTRELLELFTLGEGHYTENDIKQAARAFTGWKINRKTGNFRLARKKHDFGNKTFMARYGNFNGEDIINIILDHPQVAIHITTKLWREFISLTPDQAEVKRLAKIFRDSNYDITRLLEAMFLSPYFWNEENRGTLVKSPVDLIVGTIRTLDIHIHDKGPLFRISRRLGQDLFDPPNVKGWVGGTNWITSDSLLARQSFLYQILRSGRHNMDEMSDTMTESMDDNMDDKPQKISSKNNMKMHTSMPDNVFSAITGGNNSLEKLKQVLLPLNSVYHINPSTTEYELLKQCLIDPTYQLR